MSGPSTGGTSTPKQKFPINPIDGGVPRFNEALNIYESVPMTGGGFDPDANYSPTGQWVFTTQPYINSVDPANQLTTLIGVQTLLGAYPTTVAVSLALSAKVDTTTYNSYVASNNAAVAAKVDVATYNAYVTSNNAAVALKADTSALDSYAILSGIQTFTELNTFRRNLNIGSATTAVARVHVRGDGTAPVARFEDSAGSVNVSISNTAQAIVITEGGATTTLQLVSGNTSLVSSANNSFNIQTGSGTLLARIGMSAGGFVFTSRDLAATAAGTNSNYTFNTNINPAAGAATFRVLNLPYIINATGAQTGVIAGICINATETNLNSIQHRFIDFQLSGTSKFFVLNDGTISWGITAAEPMIKRNGTGIDFQLANNSGNFANISAAVANFNSLQFNGGGIKFIPVAANFLALNGTTNQFPALSVTSGAAPVIGVKLADNSGNFATIQAIFKSNENAVNEAVSQTHTLKIVDAAGTEYKIMLSAPGG